MEEDLKKFSNLFNAIKYITLIICGLFALIGLIGFMNGNNVGIVVSIAAALIGFLIIFFTQLQEILITRFLSATQNMYEITVMLENYFNENK